MMTIGFQVRAGLMLIALASHAAGFAVQEVRESTRLNDEGVKLHAEGRYEDAVQRFRKAIRQEKLEGVSKTAPVLVANLVQSLLGLAGQQMDASDFPAAASSLDDARALEPKSSLVQAWFGVLNFRQGYYDRAMSFLAESLLLDEGSALAHEFTGFVHYRQEALERAITAWRRAIEIDARRKERLEAQIAKAERELSVEAGMQTWRSTHFICKYGEEQGREMADIVLDWLEDAYGKIGLMFHFYPGGELTVVLYGDRDFTAATETHAWTAGLFDGKVRIPVRNFQMRRDAIRATLMHEYTHFVISNLTRACPGWLNEGLAQVAEGRKAREVARGLAKAARAGSLRGFSDLAGSFAGIRDPGVVQLAYSQSLSFTEYLISKFTLSDIESLLRALRPGVPFERPFEEVFRRPLADIEKDWRDTL